MLAPIQKIIDEQMQLDPEKLAALEARIERSRAALEQHFHQLDPELLAAIRKHRERMRARHPEEYRKLEELRERLKKN